MADKYILNEAGEPVPCPDLFVWGTWLEAAGEARRVARTEVVPGVVVSTVFLGLDHQYGQGPPLLFETMVFGGPLDDEQARYSTKAEAEAGHDQMVVRVKAALAEDKTT